MHRVWAEDLWPVVREKLRQRGVIVGAVPPPGPAAENDPGQRRLHSFFGKGLRRALCDCHCALVQDNDHVACTKKNKHVHCLKLHVRLATEIVAP